MTWKRWAVVIIVGYLVLKAPQMTMSLVHQAAGSLVTFFNGLGLH